ncbi:MAG: tRNA (N(6)-L-threonylcarbamoyladenosine(37)-C(2))-methylthiotransferase MtaB [Bacilli bacterium]|nr:tRNA (N(6)-L-threonylcarbamoyladenosine(37)-C(2))-methylthiotransferase MtaB [Bacilli bacterium]
MKVGIYTLGCKVNTYESEYITKCLIENNYEISSFDDICDIYIINTCTVTNTSDIKSRKIIRQAKRRNPNACVIAMGCYIQKATDIIDEVDIAIGNKEKNNIIKLINEYFENKEKINRVVEKEKLNIFEDMYINKYLNRTRAFIKIQDGCENFCSYCIIPFVRGKCRSKDFNKTIEEINDLVNNGFKEIVLTGIHTGNYGRDINTDFASLLKEIVKIEGLKRIRISSIEATELNKEVLDIINNNDIIVDHLHIPIQAASNEVLKIMNRKYNIDEFISKIEEIRSIRPDISITTDIIVGHPGETEEVFTKSIDNLKKIKFSKLHVFPYSKRDGTVSAGLPQIDEQIKKDRAHKLLSLSKELELDYMNKFLNKELEVLFERNNDEYSLGHTSNYLQIKVKGLYNSGEFKKVKLEEIDYPYIIGKVLD